MADFVIGDVKVVRQLNQEHKTNKHLADGWVLLATTGGKDEQGYPLVLYTLGWLKDEKPPAEYKYD